MRRRAIAACAAGVLAAACSAPPAPPAAGVGRDIPLAPDLETIEAQVPRHATLETLLRAHGLRPDLVPAVIEAARGAFDPRSLRATHRYLLIKTLDGLLRRFEYQIDAERFLRIASLDRHRPEALDVHVLRYERRTELAAVAATIDEAAPSLVAALDAAGEQVELAVALAEIFGGEVDFNRDLRQGDRVELLFERVHREVGPSGYGEIVAARLFTDGRELQAFRFAAGARPGYYDAQGRSLRRVFLKSPLKFVPRVTSGFSYRRLHPVHRVYRPHLGVDYAARYGDPVVAVADGVVVSAGWAGASGRMIRLRHARGYESYYLHLSSIARGIRPGARVAQGQLIGRVGASGTATGPHLDYRLRKDGRFVNPVAVHRSMPPGEPIPAALRAAFDARRDALAAQLASALAA
ncbi:MAG TPA: M23 family metallopeptidase, partial [Vicinamibacterales bacterium]|nr:M23 family metallopeptidase [Vicinamibacterales bacterium]